MIIKRQNMSENNWNHFKIVPLLTQSLSTVNCQLSIVNSQFGEAAKFQFVGLLFYHACAFGMGNRFDGGFTITAFRILQEERMMTV